MIPGVSGTGAWGEPLALSALVLPLLALLALRYALARRRHVAAALGGPPGLRGGREGRRVVTGALLVAALALAVLAAARPQWGAGDQALEQRGIDLVIALDVSRSMEAQDVAPSRAEASAAGLAEMLTHLTGNRVGLVVFAGSAFERAPLTVDLPVLSSMVARAQGEAPLVQPGTDLAAAIQAALRVLDVDEPARTQAILLVSDGEDLRPSLAEALAAADERGVRVYTVFAGTTSPAPLPAPGGGTRPDDLSTARPEVLQEVASATGGAFRSVEQVAGLAVEFRRLQQTQFASDVRPALVDRFPWFAGGALALLALAMLVGEGGRPPRPRLRGGVITASLVAVVLAGCGTAAWRHVEDGNRAYEEQRYEDALTSYRQAAEADADDPAVDFNIANALHRLRRLEEAAVSAQAAVQGALDREDLPLAALAHYTSGNTAFQREEWEGARDAYIAALRLDPEDRDAKANLELVLAILAPPPDEPPAGGEQEGEDGDPADPGDQEGAEGGEGEGEGDGQQGQPGQQPGEPGQGEGSPDGTPGDPQQGPAQPGQGQDGEPLPSSLPEARQALAEALGALGPEVTEAEALRILELARRANELEPLPDDRGGGPTAR